MAKADLQDLLQEGFHTYQLYLQCTKIDIGGVSNLPLLKWPDVAQSALNYAEAIQKNHELWANGDEWSDAEIKTARTLLKTDLCVAVVKPIELIYKSTREHVTKHIGKEPKQIPLSQEEACKFPIQYKNRLIDGVNDLFKTLSTMTGTEYPELRKRK